MRDENLEGAESIVVEDGAGNQHRFDLYASLEVDEQLYFILTPEGEVEAADEEEIEVLIFKVSEGESDEDLVLDLVDDEAEFLAIVEAWEAADDDDPDQ